MNINLKVINMEKLLNAFIFLVGISLLFIIFVVTGVMGLACSEHSWFSGLLLGISLSSLVAIILTIDQIDPMEVYQGKTTLEYIIRDGEIIDSTVVRKTYKPIN